MTSKTATPTIHLTELDLFDLIGQVSSEDLLDLDSLIHAALRGALEDAGYAAEKIDSGAVTPVGQDEDGWQYEVALTLNGQQLAARVDVPEYEMSVLGYLSARFEIEAQLAVDLLARPGEVTVFEWFESTVRLTTYNEGGQAIWESHDTPASVENVLLTVKAERQRRELATR
jgi:hypothetical protein